MSVFLRYKSNFEFFISFVFVYEIIKTINTFVVSSKRLLC